MNNHTSVIVPELPECDFCSMDGLSRPAKYDGRTTMGSWGNMCQVHFYRWGTGLGLGKGQELKLK